jgi:NADH-quinone oxidoreductase subunit M
VEELSIITILLALPLLGAALIAALQRSPQFAKFIALGASLLVFIGSVVMLTQYDPSVADFQFAQVSEWFPAFGVSYSVGLDSLSLPLFMLTTLLSLLVIVYSWNVTERAPFYFGLLLVLETGVMGVFSALDFFLFYIFWEIVLIPMFFLIGIWGGERRSYASMKFLIYTHVASLIMVLAIGAMYFKAASVLGYYTFSIPEITSAGFDLSFQMLVFPALLFAFCVKLPVVPVHTWLPDAHVEAPTAASVLLAGVLLKMGGYGLIRVAYMINPQAALKYTWLVVVLALLSIVYGAFVAFKQDDLKKIIAYSSISHMGFVLIGLATFDEMGVLGAIYQMVAHGLISAMLFMGCGVIQHNCGTRLISRLGGLYGKMPVAMTMLILAFFASMGIPGFMGFFAEFSVMLGVFRSFGWVVLLVALGAVLAVGYYLWAFQRVAFGTAPAALADCRDIHWFEILPMLVLLVLTLYFGLQPDVLVNYMDNSVTALLTAIA